MIDIENLYFKWLLERLGDPTPAFERLCWMLHRNAFDRRVGNDVNRSERGINLRRYFLDAYGEANIDPHISNDLMAKECSWFEMMVALADDLDFLYEGGVKERLVEMMLNMGLRQILLTSLNRIKSTRYDEVDQHLVDAATSRIDNNRFEQNGNGGLFPLSKANHLDQREVEIWDQQAAYFVERLEGVMWTSTN